MNDKLIIQNIYIYFTFIAVTLTVQGDFVPDHVGPPIACCGLKLVDVPEMEYYQSNQQGEICIIGSNVFAG
jgi:long-chain acyl-CoA synthetase